MEVMEKAKTGYKKTELGLIPEDWEIQSISRFFDFKNGLNKESEYFGYGYPIINYMDVFRNNGIYSQNILGKVFVNNDEKSNYSAKKGDVFFTRTSETQKEIGVSAVLLEDVKNCVFSGFILRARPKNEYLNLEFRKYCFDPEYLRKQIISSSSYTTRALTNGKNLSKVKLIFPPNLAEQKAIATALSDVDALIEKLEALITKKQAIKEGAMQRLLTPPHKSGQRLPSFDGEWEETVLGELVDFLDGSRRPIKSGDREKMEGIYPYYGASGIIDYVNDFIFDDELILLGEDGENILSRNQRLAFKVSGKVWVNNHAHVLKPRSGVDIVFLTELLESIDYELYNSGTAQPKLNKKSCTLIQLKIPTYPEQKAIAKILSDMDKEIEKLQAKKTKYEKIKEGMMQELLTGKTRLV